MKKTINITIAGLLFTVEEDAYEKLKQYLDGIKTHFASYPDHEDIIQDIEARIAERFSQKNKTAQNTIVTIADIDELVAAMGKVEDFEREENSSTQKSPPQDASRRLYRNSEDAIIAGVCSGIAVYFQIDPVIVRLIFGISLFFGGFGVLLYIILWVILPEAKTPMEKAQMRGTPLTLAGIQHTVRERVEEFKAKHVESKASAHTSLTADFTKASANTATPPKYMLARLFATVGMIIQKLFKLFGKIIGAILIVGAALSLFGITFALATVLFNGNSPYIDFPLTEFLTGLPYYLTLFSAFFVAFVPLLFLLILGSNIVSAKSGLGKPMLFSLLGLWIISLLSMGVLAGKYGPEVQNKIEQSPKYRNTTRQYDLKDFTGFQVSGATRLNFSRGKEFRVVASGREKDLDRLEISVEEGVLKIREKDLTHICLFCSQGHSDVEVSLPEVHSVVASGASRVEGEGVTTAETFQLKASGASRITLTLSPIDMFAAISGASTVEIKALPELSRTSRTLTLDMSGASKFNASGSYFDTAMVKISGASKAELNVISHIQGSLSGASRLSYYGTPTLNTKTSGASKVEKQDDPFEPFSDAKSEPTAPLEPAF